MYTTDTAIINVAVDYLSETVERTGKERAEATRDTSESSCGVGNRTTWSRLLRSDPRYGRGAIGHF